MMTGMDEVPDEDICKAFCAFDVSNTGYIRAEDLVRGLLGRSPLPEEQRRGLMEASR